jgi:hypothetical protein
MFIAGSNRDFAGAVAIYNGSFLLHIANYTEVSQHPVEVTRPDMFGFALMVEQDKVVEMAEAGRQVFRLWEGPKVNRSMPHAKVRVEAFPLISPYPEKPEQVVEVESQVAELKAKIDDLWGKIEVQEMDKAGLKAQITDLHVVDVKTIARMCLEASDEVLESLPHIGPTHRVHLQAWARKILGV